MSDHNRSLTLALALTAAAALPAAAGPLNPPPGPIAPTGSTVQAIKDAVDAVAADVDAAAAGIDAIRDDARTNLNAVPPLLDGSHFIGSSGSYVLTASIDGGSRINIVEIQADNVTIDLNGFAISGAIASNIKVTGVRRDIVIRNGIIRDAGISGVNASGIPGVVLENITFSGCGLHGASVGEHSTVRNVTVSNSGQNGIDPVGILAGAGSIVTGCLATGNSGDGIRVGTGCSVIDCVARSNGGDGIESASACTIRGNTCNSNDQSGIEVGSGNHVESNICDSNGPGSGTGYGVHALGTRNRLMSNSLNSNDFGVRFENNFNIFARNTLGNNGGLVSAPVGSNNQVGPFQPSLIGATNPWANFQLD